MKEMAAALVAFLHQYGDYTLQFNVVGGTLKLQAFTDSGEASIDLDLIRASYMGIAASFGDIMLMLSEEIKNNSKK